MIKGTVLDVTLNPKVTFRTVPFVISVDSNARPVH